MTRAQVIWATAFVLSMERPLPNDTATARAPEEPEEEEEDGTDS